ncbi:hypothetical protein GCM10010988_41650 [Cnuibacter physcomitrellae]|uniref:Uncharacterized protein n=1 Tax=Cnuibacter physcomitrellae TaxID=1619308 RepID=A0A1X9LRC6_9MICO|nr:hypothetical protein [Cnuibacter physcomitrellae]ARJ07733.1 hypothetical protein B5808_20255 [Cnuibacter physcomitrellae]GGI42960.1 hypothetical protein GCM10010988_41650 [Cnuibacter physcomitrellae]
MMDLSFRWPHPRFNTSVGDISFRLHTFDNVYGVDPQSVDTTTDTDGGMRITTSRLTWAGGQRTSAGTLTATVTPTPAGVMIAVTGEHADGVRSIGLTLHDRPVGKITGVREEPLDIPAAGRLLRYPNGWFDLASPYAVITGQSGSDLVVRSLDDRPRPKTYAFVPHFGDAAAASTMDIELIVEAEATAPARLFEAPAWVLETSSSPAATEATVVAHREHIEAVYPAEAWEVRADVPDWLRQKSLVLTLHGQHFTGRVFNDYDGMLQKIRRVASQIDGSRILAYLPGWEGRYYRFYGRYDVDPVMGGEDAFRRLVSEARDLGVHVMPMFGANVAARDVPGFERWAEPGLLRRPSGLTDAGSVDWDASRHYDHSGALINPAFAPWRAHLVGQIAALQHRFEFDATFLDITAMHANDPNGDTTTGLRALIDEIHSELPGHLVAGEAWFDAIGGITPLVQTGHHDNVPVFHDVPDAELFDRTNRSFGHVNLGDPAHGSSGVHEAGYVSAWRLPVRKGVIPTIGIVEDTLDKAPERVAQIVSDAHEYADRFLPVTARA